MRRDEQQECTVSTFVRKGNQAPELETTRPTPDETTKPTPSAKTPSLYPIPQWKRPGDEFLVEL